MNQELLSRLREGVGAESIAPEYSVVAPADADATVVIVRICAETSTPIAVCSNSRGSTAAAPKDGLLLNLERLTTVDVRASALTVRASAGATVSAVNARVGAEGLAITGLGDRPASVSVGGLVGRGAVSRHALAGVEAVLANGDTIQFGGVLKDVVGYDVPAVLLGSMGRLAVILAVTFRLEPASARTTAPSPLPGSLALDPDIARAFDPESLLRAPV